MSRRWRRILISFGITALVCGIYAWFFGFQTLMMLEARQVGRRAPVVWQTPQPLPTTSIASAQGLTLSYSGYQFSVPWNDLDESATKATATGVVLKFRSGKTLTFSAFPPREFVKAVAEQMKGDGLRKMYGDQFLQSDYALWSAIVNATPGKVTPLTSRKEAAGMPMLLLLKGIAAPEESGVYSLQTRDFKGFQWGKPDDVATRIVANLYSDNVGLELIFESTDRGFPMGISQAEINRVVQSVQKTSQ